MRGAAVPGVLLVLVLVGGSVRAVAQQVDPQAVAQAAADTGPDASLAHAAPGTVPQPSVAKPGVVTGVTLGELYTDNLKLAGPGQRKDGQWITVIQPFIKSAISRPRLSGVLDASVDGYLYAGRASDNQLAASLDGRGTLKIIRRHLFLDGAASYAQAVINNALPSGSGTFYLSGNRTNVITGTLSPYWVQDLGRVGTMQLRYTLGRVVYNRNGIGDTNGSQLSDVPNVTSHGEKFTLVSPDGQKWGWNALYVEQHLETGDGLRLKFATAKIGASRQLGQHFSILADVGKGNKYFPDGTVSVLGANLWDVGFAWSDSRNTFKVLGGHRFYGRHAELSWVHHAALLTTRLSYEEQPTNLNQQVLSENPEGGLTLPQGESGLPSLFERQIYLMKRATASASYEMPTGRLTLTLFHVSRDYFLRGLNHEDVSDGQVAWRFNLGPFTTLTPTFGWQRERFEDAQVNYTRFTQIVFAHQVSPRSFFTVELRHGARNTHAAQLAAAHGYRASVIYFRWTFLFGGY